MRFQRTGRLMIVAALAEILTGLSFYLVPGQFSTETYASLLPSFPLLSLGMLLGGLAALVLARFPLGTWLRQLLVLLAVAPLVMMIALATGRGFALVPFNYGPLAAALLLAPWTPLLGRRVKEGAPESDLAIFALALVEAGIGVWLLIAPDSTFAAIAAPLRPWSRALGMVGLLGCASLLLPERGGAWAGTHRPLRRAVAALLPLVLVAGSVVTGRWSAIAGFAGWLVLLFGMDHLVVPLGEGDTAAGTLGALERLLEVWGWVLALVAVAGTLVAGAGSLADANALHIFVLGIVAYSVAAFGLFRRLGTPEQRILWHLNFLSLAIAFLIAFDTRVNDGFIVLLVVAPLLALRALGPAAGNRMLVTTLVLVVLAHLRGWLLAGEPLGFSLAGAAVDVLVLLAAVLVVARDVNTARQAARALRESEARFRALAGSASDAIAVADQRGRIAYWNDGVKKMFGYAEAEVLGQPVMLLVPERCRAEAEAELQRILTTGDGTVAGRPLEIYGIRKDGVEFPIEVSASRWDTEDGHFSTGIIRDVSERHRAEAEMERLRLHSELILDAAGEGICGLDREGRTTFANPAALRMTGYSLDELLGHNQHVLIHHSWPDGSPYPIEDCPIYNACRGGSFHRVSTEVLWRKDGSSFPVEYFSTPIREGGEIVGSVLSFLDISERLAVERMKNEFVSVVSHELRTPLTSIRGALGLLAAGLMGDLPEKGGRMLEIAVNNTDRLVRLINDILDVERMESGLVVMHKQSCDAAEVMSQAADVMRPMAEKAGVLLVVTLLGVRLWADPDRIVQTLTNLLSNAIKFSPSGSEVQLSAKRLGQEIRFEVVDHGRGIPSDKLEAIFERFQQVDASDSREKGGTGLGLAICRTIIKQHGGAIWAETTPGAGSTLRFTLPLLAQEGVEPPAPLPRPAVGGPLVLVCDDDACVREVVAAMIEQHGYQSVSAASGEEAIEQAEQLHPAAIVLDLLMPGMSGWEVLDALKNRPGTRDIPIVIMSAMQPGEAMDTCEQVAAWLTKPVDETQLVSALRTAADRAGRSARVLVVEDDVDLAGVLMTLFDRHGIEAFHAASGAEAIRLSQRVEPDLLVLDVVLPGGDGFSVVDWLRRHDRLSRVPLVIYSARDLDDGARQRLRLGETEFVTKTRVPPEQFAGRIVELLGRILAEGKGSKNSGDAAHPDH